MTSVFSPLLTSSRATPSPSSFGISMSSSAMCGWSFFMDDNAASPSAASPTTFKPGSSSTLSRSPFRISGWSSAIRIRISSSTTLVPPSQSTSNVPRPAQPPGYKRNHDCCCFSFSKETIPGAHPHVEPHGPSCSILYVLCPHCYIGLIQVSMISGTPLTGTRT